MDQKYFEGRASGNNQCAAQARSCSSTGAKSRVVHTGAVGSSRQGKCGPQVYLTGGANTIPKNWLLRELLTGKTNWSIRFTFVAVDFHCYLGIEELVVPPRDTLEFIESLVQFNLNRWNGYQLTSKSLSAVNTREANLIWGSGLCLDNWGE